MLVGAAQIAIAAPLHAQERQVDFDIPAQELSKSLREFAATTDMDLLYPPQLVENRQARAVKGAMTPTAALREMLRGSGLAFDVNGDDAVTLRAVGASRSQAERGDEDAANSMVATAPLSGIVRNAATGSVLPGANVRIAGTPLRTVTDDRGQYNFPAAPQGTQTVVVEYLGQVPQVASVSVAPGVRNTGDVSVGSSSDEIVVLGYRSAIQVALNQQKNADNNSTVVASDLLGGFPAETVSEALRRVPGVAFGRDADTGEGSRITVRGFSSEAINVQLNGLDLQGTGYERTIDLSGFLADNISQVTVHKSLLPSHESTGSGGLVEIETKSGLDYGDFAFNVSVEGESNFDRDFGEEYQINGTIAKELTPSFGIAATLQYRNTDRLNYDVSILDTVPPVLPEGYTSIFFVPASFEFPFDPGLDQQLVTSTSYLRRERAEEAFVGSLNLAWDIASHTRLRLDLQRNVRDSEGSDSRTAIGFLTSSLDMPIPELDGEVRRRTTLRALRPSIAFRSTDQKFTSDTISFRGDTDIGRWEFEYKLGYSKARQEGSNTAITLLGNSFTNLEDLIDPATLQTAPDDDAAQTERVIAGGFVPGPDGLPLPSLTAEGFALIGDPGQYDLFSAVTNPIDSPSESYIGEFQARYNTPLGFLEYVELGGKYDSSKRQTVGNVTNPRNVTSQRYLRIFGAESDLALFDPDLLGADDISLIGVDAFDLPYLSAGGARTIFDILPGYTDDDPATAFNEERFTFTDFTQLDPIADGSGNLVPTETTEDNWAAYLESKLVFGDLSVIAGVRYEREKRNGFTISSPSVRLDEPGFRTEDRETFVQAGLVRFANTGGTVDTWTPSFLATYRPHPNIAARLGYFRSTVNPDFRLLNRNTQYSVDLRPGFGRVTILEANPDLKPSTTDNIDLDLAYYFDDTPGLVRAGFFYKKINNNFTNVNFTAVDDDGVRQRFLDEFAPLAESRPDLLALPEDTEFLVNRPTNGEGGKIWGLEFELIRRLDFLPGFLSDFGVLANATYTNGDFPTLVSARSDDNEIIQLSLDRPLRDQARWVYNLSLDYDRDGFQGRVIYTSQSATVDAFDEFNLNTVVPSYDTLDARLSYTFENLGGLWTIFLEGDDLLRDAKDADIRSTTSSQFGDGTAVFSYPQAYQFNGGRTVTMGVRARF